MEAQHESKTLRDLTDAQRIAINLLVTGTSDKVAAEAAGKTRETVNRWSQHHPEFRAELNRQRQRLQEQHADRCRVMNGIALGHLHQQMLDGDPEAIKTWLKISGLGRLSTAVSGHLDSEEIISEQVVRRLRRREDEVEDVYSNAFNDRIVNGGPSPEEIRREVERNLRAVTDCEPDPEDLDPPVAACPHDDLEDGET
jgi:hypothetical protein